MISNDYMKDSNLQAQIAELANSVGSGAKIQTGSYVGTGTYGASNPCSLTFDFIPKVILLFDALGTICGYQYNERITSPTIGYPSALTTSYQTNALFYRHEYIDGVRVLNMHSKKSSDGKTIYWYYQNDYESSVTYNCTSGQYNQSGVTYNYIAIG